MVLTQLLLLNTAIGRCGAGPDKQYQPSLHAGLISWWLIPAKVPMSVDMLQVWGLYSHCPVHSAAFTSQIRCRQCVNSPVGEMWDHSLYLKIDDFYWCISLNCNTELNRSDIWLSYATVHYQSESNFWSSHTFTPCFKPQMICMVMIMGKTMLLNQKNLF